MEAKPNYINFLNKLENSKTFSFTFVQEYISADNSSDKLKEKGRVYYKNDYWKWEYEGVDKRAYLIIADEVFEEDEDGVERINLTKEQFNQSIVKILKKPTEFIALHKKVEEDNLLTIIGNREDEFSKVKILFNNGVIGKIIIKSKNSDVLILYFSDFRFNIKIDDSLFHLKNKTK